LLIYFGNVKSNIFPATNRYVEEEAGKLQGLVFGTGEYKS
jgi:hypothetical protein